MGRRVRSWATLVVAAVLTLLVGLAPATTTTASSATYVYDAQSNARVDAQAFGPVKASPTPLSDTQEGSASPSDETRTPSTTPTLTLVATNKLAATGEDLLKPGLGPKGLSHQALQARSHRRNETR